MIRVAIVDPVGHAGREFLGLCARHPPVQSVTARSARTDGAVLERILGAGFSPVIATVAPAPGETDVFLNVNADVAVAPIARTCCADTVQFLSDVAHVQDHDVRIERLDRSAFKPLVKIASASGADPIGAAFQSSNGTLRTAQARSLSNV